jgi:hypothetical protein
MRASGSEPTLTVDEVVVLVPEILDGYRLRPAANTKMMISLALRTAESLSEMSTDILYAEGEDFFVTTDSPFFLGPIPMSGATINTPGATKSATLGSKVAIVFRDKGDEQRAFVARREQVLALNCLMASGCHHLILGCSRDLVAGIAEQTRFHREAWKLFPRLI